MERFQSTEARERYIDIAHLIRYSVQIPPEEIAKAISEKDITGEGNFSDTATLISRIAHVSYIEETNNHSKEGEAFLGPAIADVAKVVDVIAAKYPQLDDGVLAEIMSHPETIDTVALLALRPEWYMLPYISEQLAQTGHLSHGGGFVVEDQSLDFSNYIINSLGCPAAGRIDTASGAGEVNPTQIFTQLVPWATKLYLTLNQSNEGTTR